jgi:MFS family permease
VGDEISAMTDAGLDLPSAGGGVTSPRVSGPRSSSVVASAEGGVVDQVLGEFGQDEYGPMSLDAPPPAKNQLGVWATFRTVFRIKTVRRLVFGQTVLFAAFAGFFAFGTLFFARVYFTDELLFSVGGTRITPGEAQAQAGILIAGLSVLAIGAGAIIAAKVDDRFAATRPLLRVNAALAALLVGFFALLVFVSVEPLPIRVVAFLIFSGVNIIAVSNLSAAIADTLPARLRGSGFSAFQFLLAFGSALGAGIVGIASSVAGDDLRFGFASLLIPLIIGVLVVSRARGSYLGDADAVLAEVARGEGGPPAAPPIH